MYIQMYIERIIKYCKCTNGQFSHTLMYGVTLKNNAHNYRFNPNAVADLSQDIGL